MKLSLSALCVGLVASTALAQSTTNVFEVWSGRTSFTSRGFLGGAAGETLQGYPADHYRGIGDNGTVPKTCTARAFGMLAQDQDQKTLEKYAIVIRADDGTGKPDATDDGIIFKSGLLNLPTGTGTGAQAYTVTVNLGTAGVSIPCKDTYYVGVALSANAKWTADGQSTHASAYTTPASTAGDPVAAGAVNHAFQIDATGVVRNTNPRSWRYNLQTERGVFQVGCIQAASTTGLYGNCGNYPDADTHGLSFRILDVTQAGNPCAVFVSTDLIGGMPIPVDGTLWVNPGTFVMIASGKLSATGTFEAKPAAFAPGKLKAFKGLGELPFQGVILDVGTNRRLNLRTTNAQATTL